MLFLSRIQIQIQNPESNFDFIESTTKPPWLSVSVFTSWVKVNEQNDNETRLNNAKAKVTQGSTFTEESA